MKYKLQTRPLTYSLPREGRGGVVENITIMKKTYMIPTLQVVKIQTAQILAGSDFGQGTMDGSQAATRGAGFSDSDDWGE